MYPPFVEAAESEGNHAAAASFKNALAVEEIHHRLYGEALKAFQSGQDLGATPIHVCEVCGNTILGGVPDNCPVCGAPAAKFTEVA